MLTQSNEQSCKCQSCLSLPTHKTSSPKEVVHQNLHVLSFIGTKLFQRPRLSLAKALCFLAFNFSNYQKHPKLIVIFKIPDTKWEGFCWGLFFVAARNIKETLPAVLPSTQRNSDGSEECGDSVTNSVLWFPCEEFMISMWNDRSNLKKFQWEFKFSAFIDEKPSCFRELNHRTVFLQS